MMEVSSSEIRGRREACWGGKSEQLTFEYPLDIKGMSMIGHWICEPTMVVPPGTLSLAPSQDQGSDSKWHVPSRICPRGLGKQ